MTPDRPGVPEAVSDLFSARFAGTPTHLAWAPGRVNLIGEHVDYAGLPVLPMAIDRGTMLVMRPVADAGVRIVNADPAFGAREFEISSRIEPFAAGDWGNYLKAALQGLAKAGRELRGFDAVLASDLPAASGLASSSALVVAAALAGLVDGDSASGPRRGAPEPLELAGLLAAAEHYVGARGGGMDQAAILGGRAGSALHVRFGPLRVRPVAVPSDWRFVIAHSLEKAEKSAGARAAYNARRREVERGFAALGGPPSTLVATGSVDELLAAAASRLPPVVASRVRHVLSEQLRVGEAVSAMEAGHAEAFGRLMLASHASLRDDFEVSTEALDELVEAAGRGGALGARLTGAGLGGCIVALVRRGGEDALLGALADRFYGPRGIPPTPALVFAARSADGARVTAL